MSHGAKWMIVAIFMLSAVRAQASSAPLASLARQLMTQGRKETMTCRYARTSLGSALAKQAVATGRVYDYSPDSHALTNFQSGAKRLFQILDRRPSNAVCSKILYCHLPRLSETTQLGWLWRWQAYLTNQAIPDNATSPFSGSIRILTVKTEMQSMGENPKYYPPHKIAMMKNNRIGCKAQVKFQIIQDFAGFVTLHFWKNHCKYARIRGKPSWRCGGSSRLNHPYYTQTYYIQPSASQHKSRGRAVLSGNRGIYTVDVWANNPRQPKVFGAHKVFRGKELALVMRDSKFQFCPESTKNAFNNGCACLGLKPNKVTVSVKPDPFYIPHAAAQGLCR